MAGSIARRMKVLKSGHPSEDSIQKTVMDWVKLHPELKYIILHIPNEGKRSHSYGKRLKDMGMLSGVWDLFIASARHGYNGAWIELKSANGKLTVTQQEFGQNMMKQNYFTGLCKSIDEAIELIKWYCFS